MNFTIFGATGKVGSRVIAEAVACAGRIVALEAKRDSRVMIVGGDPLGTRHIWWNFVSSSKGRIEQAKSDWKNGRFGSVPGDSESIPLPKSQ